MRLYSKLILIIALAAGIQRFAPPSAWGADAWFAFRCHAADVLGDGELTERMVEEYYLQMHAPEEPIEENIELELVLAAG